MSFHSILPQLPFCFASPTKNNKTHDHKTRFEGITNRFSFLIFHQTISAIAFPTKNSSNVGLISTSPIKKPISPGKKNDFISTHPSPNNIQLFQPFGKKTQTKTTSIHPTALFFFVLTNKKTSPGVFCPYFFGGRFFRFGNAAAPPWEVATFSTWRTSPLARHPCPSFPAAALDLAPSGKLIKLHGFCGRISRSME